jgi:hypothetical protein
MRTLIKISFLLSTTLYAANYYVSSAGSDSNPGSSDFPWLTLGHAVGAIACGDTINIVANGSYVAGDVNLPYFPGCGLTTKIQSSALSQFAPVGYRTNPVTDAANYGKLMMTGGISTQTERHGAYGPCQIASIVGATITMGYCGSGMPNLANGQQVSWEINNSANLSAATLPSPFVIFTHYYVKNCSAGCGTAGSTLELAATSGGASITPGSCTGTCILGALQLGVSIQVTAGSATMTSPDAFIGVANGTPVALSEAGLQAFGTLPAEFARNTLYYVVNLAGRNFGLAATPGGTAIVPSDAGSGPLIMATTQLAHDWLFDGLEFYSPTNPTALLAIGNGAETSVVGMARNFEVRRSYFHGDSSACPSSGPTRGIVDNGINVSIHDNVFKSFCTGEGQAIVAYGSPGPTLIQNNFLEAAAEITMSGGLGNSSGIANTNRTFIGNYYYKPPSWKVTTGSGVPTGSCWYDATDSLNAGGEWYRDSVGAQNYRCTSGFTWATTGASLPRLFTIKNMAEHKDGRSHTYIGNLFNYSWVSAQSGQALAFHQGEDSGPGRANDNVTAMHNKVTNVYQFTTDQSHCNLTTIYCAFLPTQHVVVNNLAILTGQACGVPSDPSTCGYHMHDSNIDGYPASASFRSHNTVVMPDGSDAYPLYQSVAFFASTDTGGSGCPPAFGPIDLMTFKNSITATDFQGDCYNGGGMLSNYFTHSTFTNNALVNHNAGVNYGSPGATNTFTNFATPANNAAVQFTADYHLSSTSPFSAQNGSHTLLSDDGTDLGADIDLINMATSGAAAGTPPWNVQAGLRVTAGSTSTVFRYTAPTSDACTAQVFGAPARIAANQAASVADSSPGSISNGTTRELYVSGLLPSKHYWYSLACGGGVLMVGEFLTRSAGNGIIQFAFDWSSPTPMLYSSSPTMAGATSLPAATRQFIPVASNSVVYAQQGIAGPITMLIAP